MKYQEYYSKASKFFLNYDYESLDYEEKSYFYIGSVIFSWIRIESYINMISDSLSNSTRIELHLRKFLLEKELKVNDDGLFIEVNSRPPTTKKLLFILENFSRINVQKFKQTRLWKEVKNFEDLRNKIIHHKDKNNIKISYQKAKEVNELADELINFLTKKVFKN